ncbi:MAG TPA: DUF4062 domain-containing protein, partial [Patescibacteria group bacterium]|nr:DUF4062 domain-containing protein [Patescibacteria group bacterium]
MNKKLQVFISSTYTDLQEERQSAVEAILNAGHIPAGMELFKAGNETQLDTIKRWIDQSDVYLLILGGRYGSIEQKSEKSYIHLEYEYAISKDIPIFALVLKDEAIDQKLQAIGKNSIEQENYAKYVELKKQVASRMCKFVMDGRDIKLAIFETLNEFQQLYKFAGWVSGKELPDVDGYTKEIIRLSKEVERLRKIEEREKELKAKIESTYNNYSFLQIVERMISTSMTIPGKLTDKSKDIKNDLLALFLQTKSSYAIGITNEYGMSDINKFLYFELAPELMVYGLVEKVKVTGARYERIQTTKLGNKFLMEYEINLKSKMVDN